MVRKNSKVGIKVFLSFDSVLWIVLVLALFVSYFGLPAGKFGSELVIVVAFIATAPVVISAARAIKNKKITIDLLAGIALFISLATKQWNSVIFINLMITSARIFSDYTEARAKAALESLVKLRPQKARILKGTKVLEIPVEEIKVNDLVLVELGEQIPIDGVVSKGEAEIDQSSLTGESLPVFKKAGDKVLSSTIVQFGNLVVLAERVGRETTFEKFIKLVEESQGKKANIVSSGEKFSAWYIAITILASIIIYLFSKNIGLVLGVLLVSCADDIAVAVPLAFLTSIGHAARHGAIIKGGNYIEVLSKANIVLFDKTGTLTKGNLKVEEIVAFNEWKEEDVLSLAVSVFERSNHPSAKAVIKYSKNKKIKIGKIDELEEFTGRGIRAVVEGKKIITGKLFFLEESGIKIDKHQMDDINREKEKGFNTTLIGLGNELIGFIVLADEIRPEIKAMVGSLKKQGIEKIIMLTGDNEKIAARVAQVAGIREFHSNLLPEDKLNYIKKYTGEGYKTIMIGDGVNDAAALALADVGIAMGTIGSDAAIESADVALMHDDIKQVPELLKIGKSTMKIIKQDLWLWGAVNVLGLILVFAKVLGPEGAAAYNFATDFIPLINSLRLFR